MLFGGIFGGAKKEPLVLIDINAGSVGGAYVVYNADAFPTIVYQIRTTIEIRSDEPQEKAMLRCLAITIEELITKGAPALLRITGSGRAGTVLVSVDAPWQETRIRAEAFERSTSFIFTKAMLSMALEKTSVTPPGKTLADESIIGTVLNGYETHAPFGKRVHRATVLILTSFIPIDVSDAIVDALRNAFHTRHILSIAGTSLRYQALRALFAHERSAIVLDAIGPCISIALVRKGMLVETADIINGVAERQTNVWVEEVRAKLTSFATQFPLPRTIFLLSQEDDAPYLEGALTAASLSALWLSDQPPKIVPVLASHLQPHLRLLEHVSTDIPLMLMAYYWKHRLIV